jgi:uncharacterized Zn-binding protein involved in type VI secretion
MAGEIIRKGDPTSHGGVVLEGSMTDICMGQPIAFLGHKVHCPKCKGVFPIAEGVPTTTFYGKGVALAGMKTACGAVLIATQFSDTVEYGSGAAQRTASTSATAMPTALAAAVAGATPTPPIADAHDNHKYDLVFRVQDESTGKALAYTRYRITLDDGTEIIGTTDDAGMTEKACSDHLQNATIEVPYYDHDSSPHTNHEHYACDC